MEDTAPSPVGGTLGEKGLCDVTGGWGGGASVKVILIGCTSVHPE